jgi:hypothetical protein
MTISIPHTFTNGTIAEASQVNANFTAVQLYVDGLSSGTYIDSLSITNAKLAANAVTSSKITDGTVTYVKLDSTDVPNGLAVTDQIVLASQVFG